MPSITAIICLYKRQDYLEEQLLAISQQTLKVTQIVLLQNSADQKRLDLSPSLIQKYQQQCQIPIKTIRSDFNSLFFRWIIGYTFSTDYIWVSDDDAIPGVYWLDLAYQTHLRHQALVGPAGRIVYQWQPNSFTKDVSTYAKNKIDKHIQQFYLSKLKTL